MGISVVSLAELYEGFAYSRNPVASASLLGIFLDDVDIFPLDEGVCRLFGVERGRLRSVGTMIGDFDLLRLFCQVSRSDRAHEQSSAFHSDTGPGRGIDLSPSNIFDATPEPALFVRLRCIFDE